MGLLWDFKRVRLGMMENGEFIFALFGIFKRFKHSLIMQYELLSRILESECRESLLRREVFVFPRIYMENKYLNFLAITLSPARIAGLL